MLLESVKTREFTRVVYERNATLQYSHYTVKGDIPVEVYISNEMRGLGLSFRNLKRLARAELSRVDSDPFGDTSIDPHLTEDFAQEQRAVNRLVDSVQELVGQPIAIKSAVAKPGSYLREDLIDQYLFMRELQLRSQERLTEEQRTKIGFLPVYGAVRVGEKDFLFMKYIQGASEIQDQEIAYPNYGWMGSGDPDTEMAFSRAKHKDLLKVMDFEGPFKGSIRWRHVTRELGIMIGMRLHDLVGRNVLFYQEEGVRKYVVIDQVRKAKGRR